MRMTYVHSIIRRAATIIAANIAASRLQPRRAALITAAIPAVLLPVAAARRAAPIRWMP